MTFCGFSFPSNALSLHYLNTNDRARKSVRLYIATIINTKSFLEHDSEIVRLQNSSRIKAKKTTQHAQFMS